MEHMPKYASQNLESIHAVRHNQAREGRRLLQCAVTCLTPELHSLRVAESSAEEALCELLRIWATCCLYKSYLQTSSVACAWAGTG